MGKREFRSIQYLRGIAALAVVIKHAFQPTYGYALGYGVDLFFVISGFVMVASTRKPTQPGAFIARRAWRILPMWCVTLAIVAAAGVATGTPGQWLSSVFLIPYGIESGVGTVVWGVGWTLCFEALFYLIFAVGLWVGSALFTPAVMVALVVGGMAFGRPETPILNNLVHPMLLEFLFGYAIAHAVFSGRKFPAWLIPLGVVLMGLTIAYLPSDTATRPIVVGIPLALIVGGLIQYEDRLPKSRILHFLGDASYSIYLLHYAPIMLFAGVFGGPILLLLGVGLGCGAYWFIERPMLRLRTLRLPRLAKVGV